MSTNSDYKIMIFLLYVSFFNVDSLIKVAPPRLYNSTNIIAPARRSAFHWFF